MEKKLRLLMIMVTCVALLFLAVPAYGNHPHTNVSGLECVYVIDPGQTEITGQVIHIKGQVNQNRFYSDDQATLPDGTNTAVLDITLNLQSGMAVWKSTSAVFQPDGVQGTFTGNGGGWLKMDPATFAVLDSKGRGVFHGTGELEGLTLKQDLYAGDITQCPWAPNLFDATYWQGFIVPPGE